MGRDDSDFALSDYGVTSPPFAMWLRRDESAYRKLSDIEESKIWLGVENRVIGLSKRNRK
jgi:hypothetical protein